MTPDRVLVLYWEDVLADRVSSGLCAHCGKPVVSKGKRGPAKAYCNARCRKAAERARRAAAEAAGDPYVVRERYIDAFPPDRARLNAPVQPRPGEAEHWAWEVLGDAD